MATKRCKECGFRVRSAGHNDGPHHSKRRSPKHRVKKTG